MNGRAGSNRDSVGHNLSGGGVSTRGQVQNQRPRLNTEVVLVTSSEDNDMVRHVEFVKKVGENTGVYNSEPVPVVRQEGVRIHGSPRLAKPEPLVEPWSMKADRTHSSGPTRGSTAGTPSFQS